MRSKSIHVALLLTSVALAGCGESTTSKNYGEGMTFSSYEDCSVNIGPENCQKDAAPVQAASGTSTSSGGGGSNHSSSSFVFLPIPSFSGGYRPEAPRAQSSYVPSSPAFAANPAAASAARSGTSFSSAKSSTSSGFSSSSARGGFGSTASSFSASS